MKKKLVLGASLGNCVHIAGVVHFLDQAREEGWEAEFLGPAVSPDALLARVRERNPDLVAVGYRLTPANAVPLVRALQDGAEAGTTWLFGGTKPVAEAVQKLGFFDIVLDGREDLDDTRAILRGGLRAVEALEPAQTFAARVAQKQPYPLLRHHFGLPSYEETLAGVREIAASRVLDVLSLGIDQNTQQYFFHPELRDPAMDGAGGVPVRTEAEFAALKAAADAGNRPLLRCYSGTADVLRFGETLRRTIDNAWCAVPLCWYNELDGRGARTLETSIREAQALIRWHAERDIPVEINEPHHWGLRDAHDTISVAMAYISAYNAKKLGVGDYIAQYMFNIPSALSFSMDLAKVLAQIELVESLAAPDFHIYRETRAGLPLFHGDPDIAKGQLAASTMLQMNVKPQIIHVVGYAEAERAATPEIVIESCRIVRGVIRQTLQGAPDATCDPAVQARKQALLREARTLLDWIETHYAAWDDPLANPDVIADCVRTGVLDAPHILKNERYTGVLRTRIVDGRCVAWDGHELTEAERLARFSAEGGRIDA